VLSLTAALSACTPLDRLTPAEHLDTHSGETLVVANRPIVFARERSDVAARARDYTTLVAVEADRAGKYQAYLLAHRWTTIDRRVEDLPSSADGTLRLVADGREMLFKPLAAVPEALKNESTLHAPDNARYTTWAYATDLATLQYVAESEALTLRFPRENLPIDFTVWTDGREAWREFATRGARR
jgi:hypothetical protein